MFFEHTHGKSSSMTAHWSSDSTRVVLKWRIGGRLLVFLAFMVALSLMAVVLDMPRELYVWIFPVGGVSLFILTLLTTRMLIFDGPAKKVTFGLEVCWLPLTKTIPVTGQTKICLTDDGKFELQLFQAGEKLTTIDESANQEKMKELANLLADAMGFKYSPKEEAWQPDSTT